MTRSVPSVPDRNNNKICRIFLQTIVWSAGITTALKYWCWWWCVAEDDKFALTSIDDNFNSIWHPLYRPKTRYRDPVRILEDRFRLLSMPRRLWRLDSNVFLPWSRLRRCRWWSIITISIQSCFFHGIDCDDAEKLDREAPRPFERAWLYYERKHYQFFQKMCHDDLVRIEHANMDFSEQLMYFPMYEYEKFFYYYFIG